MHANRSCWGASVIAALIMLGCASSSSARPSDETVAPLKTQLDKKTTVQFLDTPLQRALDYLQREAGVPFVIDRKQISVDAPVSLDAASMSIRAAMDWVCTSTGADWDVRDSVVVVSSRSAIIESHLKLEVYDVRSLVQPMTHFSGPAATLNAVVANTSSGGSGTGIGIVGITGAGHGGGAAISVFANEGGGGAGEPREEIVDSLLELIRGSIGRADEWVDRGGLLFSIREHDGLLYVRVTPELHGELRAMLDRYRSALSRMVSIEARFVLVRSSSLDEWLARRQGSLALDAPAATAIVDSIKRDAGGAQTLGMLRTICFNNQRVALTAGNEALFLSDVEPVAGAAGVDVTLSVARHEANLDVRPTIEADGKSITLLIRSDVVIGSGNSRKNVPAGGVRSGLTLETTGSIRGAVEKGAGTEDVSAVSGSTTSEGELIARPDIPSGTTDLDLADQDVLQFRTMARVTTGGAVVLSGMSSQFKHLDVDGKEVVLILRASVVE